MDYNEMLNELLIERDGWTELIIAAWNGQEKMVNALLKTGSDVNAQNNNGWTALMSAAQKGHKEIVDALLQANADVNVKNNKEGTVLDIAIERGHNNIVGLIKYHMEKQVERQECVFDLNI